MKMHCKVTSKYVFSFIFSALCIEQRTLEALNHVFFILGVCTLQLSGQFYIVAIL